MNKLKYLIKKKRCLENIELEMDLKDYEIFALIEKIEQEGYTINYENDRFFMQRVPRKKEQSIDLKKIEAKSILYVSDTHIGSKFARVDLLDKAYRIAHEQGIDTVLHTGDISNGIYYGRKDFEKETEVIGWFDSLDCVVNKYPSYANMTTYFIGGNHDATYKAEFGKDIGEAISQQRKDLIYLGEDSAELKLGRTKIRLFHGSRKLGCDRNSKMKVYYDSLPQNKQPDILLMGHYHHSGFMKHKDSYFVQCPALLDETPYASRMGYKNEKGVWILNLTADEYGDIIQLEPELLDFTESKQKVLKRKK